MRELLRLATFVAVVSLVSAGCDRPPDPPHTAAGKELKVLSVSLAEREELEAATSLEQARVNYRHRLEVLKGYYEKFGNMDKLIWIRREIENLEGAQTFLWDGLPQITPPAGESLAAVDERILAEYVVIARNAYINATDMLAAFYRDTNQNFKGRLIGNMQQRLDPIRTYKYFLNAEVPPADLKPIAVIPEADTLFNEALRLHESGKGFLHIALTTNYDKQRLALAKFRELIEKYPTSNKIPESAYYIADIYKEYFNENIRAVHWYRRAWQWDPNITKPARFQAATVYDIRLQDIENALMCYQATIEHERFNMSNVVFSRQRIKELTGN
jgi:TolA-binding protein